MPHVDPVPSAHCSNCDAPLHGAYCQQCGQQAHDPLASLAHAVEDVFESFWHVDGRIFRSLRDLLVPGRIARSSLDGHRSLHPAAAAVRDPERHHLLHRASRGRRAHE